MKTKNLPVRNSINPSPLRRAFFLIPLLLVCFAFAQKAQAVNPPPDGGYPGANTAEGTNALFSLTTGVWNTALGFQALYHDTTGNTNTATGLRALFSNTTGNQNVANGVQALYSNTTGELNTATGYQALFSNTEGLANVANGYQALYNNTRGGYNTANGFLALASNPEGIENAATGAFALASNTTGTCNTATGTEALAFNTTGYQNTATGVFALFGNTTGRFNTANGFNALQHNTTGFVNIALGINAGSNLTTGSWNIDIGNVGVAGESGTIRIGSGNHARTFIAAIRGVTTGVADAVPVLIDSSGRLGTTSSSRRSKNEIKPMDSASEAILALKPVTFHYKSDASGTPQFGLIAEEVAEINPDLVVRDADGEIYSVRYDAVNAMLLNEFLKEHRKAQQREATITELTSTVAQQRKDFEATTAQQQKEIQALTASVKEQAAQIQKVSAQLEVNKTAPQTVLNNQ